MDADPPPLRPADEPAGSDAETAAGLPPRRRVRVARFKFFVPKPTDADAGPAVPETAAAPGIDAVLAVAVLFLAAFLASFAATNSDLWPHLASGRLVAAGQFPFGTDPFSAVGASWVNASWLSDLAMYLLYRPDGAALVAAKAGLVVALAAVLLGIRRPGGGGLGPAATTVLVLLAASPAFVLRPAVISYLFFAVLLLTLNRSVFGVRRAMSGNPEPASADAPNSEHHSPNTSPGWCLPLAIGLLFLFWVNLDGGFVFGLLLLAAWTFGSALQRVLPLGDRTDTDTEFAPGILAVALAVAVVACVINPYHVRVFRLPPELAAIGLPDAVQAAPLVRSWFGISPLESGGPDGPGYVEYAGAVPATALYLLMAVAVASFAVNAGGWRWTRALAWAAFAWLGSHYGRLVPYLALVCGPIAVLNVQAALARRREARAGNVNRRLSHLRAALANLARAAQLLATVILLALAWPGWLARDAREAAPSRRVAWRVVPDATFERLAKRLAGWYAAGELRAGEARGFHMQPDFSAYCAWYCPAEKGMIDSRLTAPADVIVDYLALQRKMRAVGTPQSPEHPGPPDTVLSKYGITHVVIAGREALHDAPDVTGLAMTLFTAPARWPAWAIEGRGVVCGWRDAHLRLDPIRLAIGAAAEPLPPEPDNRDASPPPEPPSIWDRFRSAPAPTPPDAYEAGLWLAYREAVEIRAVIVAIPFWQAMNFLVRSAPAGPPVIGTELIDVSNVIDAAWWRSPEGRRGRAATLLAVRAARRAIRSDPDDPEAYVRLALGYGHLDTDQMIGLMQRLAVARQGLARLAAAPRRPAGPREELFLNEQLYALYRNAIVVPGTQMRAIDLWQESLARVVELRRSIPHPADDPRFEQRQKGLEQELNRLSDTVGKSRDEVENAARNQPSRRRAEIACHYGLAREALNTLRDAPPNEMDVGSVLMYAHLLLVAGDAENSWGLLYTALGSPERFPISFRVAVDRLAVQAAAAAGDTQGAIDRCNALLEVAHQQSDQEVARLAANLVFAGAGPSPFTPGLLLPAWGGLWRQEKVAMINNMPLLGDVQLFVEFRVQATDWLARQGILALESGNIPLARRRLTEAAAGVGGDRDLARRWLEAWNTANR
jgi:hypothetical protein